MTLRHPPTGSGLGLLLVGHGTRDSQGLCEFRQVGELLAAKASGVAVEVCFLELAEPSIRDGIARLVDRGVRQIIVLPLLLFSAGHAQRDIPQAVQSALDELHRAQRIGGHIIDGHGSLPPMVRQAPVLGCHPDMIEVSARRYREAIAGAGALDQSEGCAASTLLLMVGRGSNEAQANAEFARFARLRGECESVGRLETCFVAMASPTLDQGLQLATSTPFERIVVQPHLLFSGELLHGIHAAVAAARQRAPDRQWIVADPIGADDLLVRALLSRAGLDGNDLPDSNQTYATRASSASRSVLARSVFANSVLAKSVLADSIAPPADIALPEPNV